jgi:multiple sugar transport system substrate-binding protein
MACDVPGTARLLHDPTYSAVAGWHSVALYPAGPDGRRASWTGCPTFAIPELCPDRSAAADLLLFLTGHESQMREGRDGAIPSRVSTYRQLKDGLREGTLGHLRFTVAEQTLRLAVLTPPKLPEYLRIEERLWPFLQQAITGDREVADALQAAASAVDTLSDPSGGR